MMKNTRILVAVSAVLLGSIFYWFYFIDTLKLSQITGKPANPIASIFINVIDFDTGLTRYDIANLSGKSEYWKRRIQEVNAIQDPERKNIANTKLLAEMMDDPSMKKIMKKLAGFGMDAVSSILQAVK
jgi:hypothetical protein